jgi:hypothetical protein
MSSSTPRKRGHRHHPSSGRHGHLTSDYESDAAVNQPPPPSSIPPRTNTELNLSVLRRYLPSIRSILSIAANAVVYTFAHAEGEWEKSGVEGTLFVCEQEAVNVAVEVDGVEQTVLLPRACVFILNRRGLDNVVVDLATVDNCELAGEFLLFQLESGDSQGPDPTQPKVLGLWMHAAESHDDTRETNAAIIRESWQQVREAAEEVARQDGAALAVESSRRKKSETVGPAMQALGRKLSISELFGGHGGEETEG